MSGPLPHVDTAQSISTKLEGTEELGAEAFSSPSAWAAPSAASMVGRFISKDFLEKSTERNQCRLCWCRRGVRESSVLIGTNNSTESLWFEVQP